jgi:glycosyltransferase involved in cell wall biosynthesis
MLGWEFPPFVSGGLGVHCFELTRCLCAMGYHVDFFMPTSGNHHSAPPFANIRLIEVAKTELRPYLFFSKSSQKASYGQNLIAAVNEYSEKCVDSVIAHSASEKYDILHSHDWLTCRPAVELSKKLGLPLVSTFHSTEFDRTSWPWDYILDVERASAQNADLLIAVSQRTKSAVLRLGASERKIRVVYNGVDSQKFSSSSLPPSAHEFKKGKKIVLFLGRLTEQKGPVQFLHAAKKVLCVNPDTLFVVAGKGELLPLLINMSLELGISKSVRFLGFVPEEEQRMIYKMADVYVMPSTSEPFGITALEAMASGVPVIISKTSGVSEIVKSAIKVDFWDINRMAQAMVSVMKYPHLSRALSSLSSQEVRAHTWQRASEQTVEVYKEAINTRAANSPKG